MQTAHLSSLQHVACNHGPDCLPALIRRRLCDLIVAEAEAFQSWRKDLRDISTGWNGIEWYTQSLQFDEVGERT